MAKSDRTQAFIYSILGNYITNYTIEDFKYSSNGVYAHKKHHEEDDKFLIN